MVMPAELRSNHVIASTHPDWKGRGRQVDFSEFWAGAPDRRTSSQWKGGFRGRPALADALWPHIQLRAVNYRREAVVGFLSMLRCFYRFLDAYEAQFDTFIERLEDVGDAIGILWIRPPADGRWGRPMSTVYSQVKGVLEAANAMADRRFWWPSAPARNPQRPDTPTEAEARALLHELKRSAHEIYHRWARADDLAASGRNLLDLTRRKGPFRIDVSEADCHATFRALIEQSGNALPTRLDLIHALGLGNKCGKLPDWWPVGYMEIVTGLYPTHADLAILGSLFLARSGWNPATALSLDIQDPQWAQPVGNSKPALWWIQSFKERSNTWQDTISPERLSTGCYGIVSRLAARSAPLRDLVGRDSRRASMAAIAHRSPWVGAAVRSGQGSVVALSSPQTINKAIAQATEDANARAQEQHRRRREASPSGTSVPPPLVIRDGITSSDFRDAFASFVFRDSRYAWVLTQWALGHKHPRTTRKYLRSRAWQANTRDALSRFGTILFDEIEVHRRIDPVILKARSAGHEPDAVQMGRLADWRRRTYVGMGCREPTEPDPAIDPTHPRDGRTSCANTHRCASCSQGVVFDDSLSYLCRRIAELEWLQRQSSMTQWADSSHPEDLETLRATVSQWPSAKAQPEIASWAARITDGTHRVIRFGGAH